MKKQLVIILVLACLAVLYAADSTTTATSTTVRPDSTASASVADSTVAAPVPLCTLDVVTEPAGALIIIDGTTIGSAPLAISNVALGKHTIVLQKNGYFQKKVTVTLADAQKVPLTFQLSAPGRLTITTVPAQASITLNGEKRGTTPFVDSLLRPGTYRFAIEKTDYLPMHDSVVIAGNDAKVFTDTLVESPAYRDSITAAAKKEVVMKRRLNLSIIGGAFFAFLVVIGVIEARQ